MKTIISLNSKFFRKRASNCYLQRSFYNYIDSTVNKSFFSELKQLWIIIIVIIIIIFKKSESYRTVSRLQSTPSINLLELQVNDSI